MSGPQVNETAVVEVQRDFMPVELAIMKDKLSYLDTFVKSILKKGEHGKGDYGLVPGTNKPTMFKPGAEKLAFAFGLEARYSIVSKIEEPFKEWDYEVVTNKQTGEMEKRSVRGYFKYTILCELFNRSTGERWGSQLADCDSLERGRETSPSNTVMKMAEKRAYVGAVLNATFTSDRFTQDIDDYKGDQAPSGGGSGGKSDSFASKYGTADKPSFCGFCEDWHVVVGDIIIKTGKQYEKKDGKMADQYGAVACRDKKKDGSDNNTDQADKQSGDDTTDLILSIQAEEEALKLSDKDIEKRRMTYMGKTVLNEVSRMGLKNYLSALERNV